MNVTYTIEIDKVKSIDTGGRANVIQRVEWTLVGVFEGLEYRMPQSTSLLPPVGDDFIPFASVTAANLRTWIERDFPGMADAKRIVELALRDTHASNTYRSTEGAPADLNTAG